MSKEEKSRASYLGPAISLVIVLVSVYVRRPDFRNYVDGKFALVKETVEKHFQPSERQAGETSDAAPGADPGAARPQNPPVADSPDASVPPPQAGARPGAVADAVKGDFDLQKVWANPSLWPKTVMLKRNVYFPAVLDGKTIGTLKAPIGTEARLVTIRSGKLGLEYRGGGAWLDPAGTDFEERARLAYH